MHSLRPSRLRPACPRRTVLPAACSTAATAFRSRLPRTPEPHDRGRRRPHAPAGYGVTRTGERRAAHARQANTRRLRRALFRGGPFDPAAASSFGSSGSSAGLVREPGRPMNAGCCVAARGTTNRGTCVPRTATGIPPETGTTTSVSELPVRPAAGICALTGAQSAPGPSRAGHDERHRARTGCRCRAAPVLGPCGRRAPSSLLAARGGCRCVVPGAVSRDAARTGRSGPAATERRCESWTTGRLLRNGRRRRDEAMS